MNRRQKLELNGSLPPHPSPLPRCRWGRGRSGARRLRRFNFPYFKTLVHRSGVNAALRFRGSMREIFREILSPFCYPVGDRPFHFHTGGETPPELAGETPALHANAPEFAERPGLAERCELGQLAVRKQPERRASPGRYVAADARLNAHFCGR